MKFTKFTGQANFSFINLKEKKMFPICMESGFRTILFEGNATLIDSARSFLKDNENRKEFNHNGLDQKISFSGILYFYVCNYLVRHFLCPFFCIFWSNYFCHHYNQYIGRLDRNTPLNRPYFRVEGRFAMVPFCSFQHSSTGPGLNWSLYHAI